MNAQLIHAVDYSTQQQHAFHARLTAFNARRFRPALPAPGWERQLGRDLQMQVEEGDYLESERLAVQPWLGDLPSDADSFMRWFENLRGSGPGQSDPLFPWLANTADMTSMRWFLGQEVAGEAGFDDLVALTQVRFPTTPKMEMARNYWDEMGRGHEHGMHGGMLTNTAREFDLATTVEETVWEALALANVMAGLAANRRYAYHSVGALGAIEMTAPGRVSLVNEGLKRLGVSARGRQYFQLHAGLDVRHSEAWNREVIFPLVSADMSCASAIAEGALMRLRCGERCFQRYRAEFGF
ncbi:MAG: iron-containing redox enzyme family protein [Rudaea sp.]